MTILLAGLLAQAARGADNAVELWPGGQVADWVMDESSGRVFCSLYADGKAVEMDPASGKQVREIPLAEHPKFLGIKAGKLIAAVEGGASLHIFDLKTNQVEGKVQLSGKGPHAMFYSRANNPYVYVIFNTGTAWWDGEIFQVDVVQRKVKKSIRVQGWSQSHITHGTMSADGKWIVLDARGASSPSGADLMAVDEEAFTFTQQFRYHDTFGQMSADSIGRFWMFGNLLYSLDIRTRLREFKGRGPAAIHPTYDLVVTGGGDRNGAFDRTPPSSLIFQTFSTAERIGEVAIGDVVEGKRNRPRPGAPNESWTDDAIFQFDVAHDRLFAGSGDKAYVVDLKSLGQKFKPLLLLSTPGSLDAPIGQALKIPLTLSDPKLATGAKFSVESAPKGMTLTGSQLAWTPGSADVGEHRVTLKVEKDGSSDSATMTLRVTRPSVEFSGPIREMTIDNAGARALVYVTVAKEPGRPQPMGEQAVETELFLVDLKTMQIVARRKFDEQFQAIGLTATGVFVAPMNVSRIQRLKLTDLSDEARTFTNGNVIKMELLPFGDLVLFQQNGAPQRYDGQKLTPASWVAPNGYDHYGRQTASIGRVNGASVVGPMVIDVKANAIRMLQSAPGLPTVISDPQGQQNQMRFGGEAALGLWGRRMMGNQLVGPNNTVISQAGEGVSTLVEAYPALATLVSATEGANDKPSKVIRIDFRNLVDGTRTEPLNLLVSSVDRNRQNSGYQQQFGSRLFERAGRLFASVENRLFVADLPADRLKDMPVPLYYVQKMDPIQAPVKGELAVKCELFGGKGSKTYELPGSPEGTKIDPKTGVITVDTQRVWEKHLESLGGQQGFSMPGTNPAAGPVEQARTAYRNLMGRDPAADVYPLAVHLRAVAKDDENQKAELSGYLILFGPVQQVQTALQKNTAATPMTRPAFGQRFPGNPATLPIAEDENESTLLRARILELERRNAQLEGQVEMLKDLIRGSRGPATQPSR